MERVLEDDGSDDAPWRLVPAEEALSRIVVVALSVDDLDDAHKAVEELRALITNGEMFMAVNMLGRMFMGSMAETQEFVADHGGWVRPCNAN